MRPKNSSHAGLSPLLPLRSIEENVLQSENFGTEAMVRATIKPAFIGPFLESLNVGIPIEVSRNAVPIRMEPKRTGSTNSSPKHGENLANSQRVSLVIFLSVFVCEKSGFTTFYTKLRVG